MCVPLYFAFVAGSLTIAEVQKVPLPWLPGDQFVANLQVAWVKANFSRTFVNSVVVALGITAGKIAVSLLSAFAITYFRFRYRMLAFWLIFVSLMLPIEVRIVPTFEAVANAALPLQWLVDTLHLADLWRWISGHEITIALEWNMVNTYPGLILPLIASATATFLFRQFFLTVPDELCEAARLDGASPLRFFWSILLPLSVPNMVALAIILFLFGWNQYLWPLLFTDRQGHGNGRHCLEEPDPARRQRAGLERRHERRAPDHAAADAGDPAVAALVPRRASSIAASEELKWFSLPDIGAAAIFGPRTACSAFASCCELDVDAVEFDVHQSSDGGVVVIHDPLLDRTAHGSGPVGDRTLQQLTSTRLRDAGDECIPTLSSVLDVYASTSLELHIEIKTDALGRAYQGLEAKIVEEVRRRGLERRAVITCFVPEVVETVRRLSPDAQRADLARPSLGGDDGRHQAGAGADGQDPRLHRGDREGAAAAGVPAGARHPRHGAARRLGHQHA